MSHCDLNVNVKCAGQPKHLYRDQHFREKKTTTSAISLDKVMTPKVTPPTMQHGFWLPLEPGSVLTAKESGRLKQGLKSLEGLGSRLEEALTHRGIPRELYLVACSFI